METNNKLAELLNDLIKINNDRVAGYEKAIKELPADETDLKILFEKYAKQSRQYSNELAAYLANKGSGATTSTTVSGKIYRIWMDIKATISDKERKSVLAACEFGEDAAQRAYEKALESDAEIPAGALDVISKQKLSLKVAHDTIKRYRDLHAAAK